MVEGMRKDLMKVHMSEMEVRVMDDKIGFNDYEDEGIYM